MALSFLGLKSDPMYLCLSSDIGLDNKIVGANVVGGKIFLTDTKLWKLILLDLTLQDFAYPTEITIDPGTITIGEVEIHQPVADAIAISPHYGTQSVGTSGVAQPLISSATYAISLLVFPKPANTSSIYFGTSAVNKTNSKQIVIAPSTGVVSIDAPVGYKLGVNTFFVDSDVNGEGVNFMYLG